MASQRNMRKSKYGNNDMETVSHLTKQYRITSDQAPTVSSKWTTSKASSKGVNYISFAAD